MSKDFKYITSNDWSNVSKQRLSLLRKCALTGVLVKELPSNHFLGNTGEKGLFATQVFQMFDIIGEYCGEIVPTDVCGHYVAALEDKAHEDSLGLNAEYCGNETRYINSYLNIGFYPNAVMKTCYINSFPKLLIICTATIEIGDEILLDYGTSYNEAYLGQESNSS